MIAKLSDIQWSDYFYYDESSPTCLRWKIDTFCGKNLNRRYKSKGDCAGNSGKGKCLVVINKKPYLVHRVIWEIFNGKIEDLNLVVDHINGNEHDNRVSNLRLITRTLNAQNRRRNTGSKGNCGVKFQTIVWNGKEYDYWCSSWWENSKSKKAYFSVAKLGNSKAEELANEHRKATIERLNNNGADYTERHGK